MVVVWDTRDYQPLASTVTDRAMHEVLWDPFSANEMVAVGSSGQLLFWLLDEDSEAGKLQLKVRESHHVFQNFLWSSVASFCHPMALYRLILFPFFSHRHALCV